MLKRDFYIGFFLIIPLLSSITASCQHSISCPCGNKRERVFYTQCVNDASYPRYACKPWANCETCKSNTSNCLTCPPNRSGPTCTDDQTANCPDPGSIQFGYRQLINGVPSKNSRTYSNGQSFQYFCNDGYELQGNMVLTCLSSGKWSSNTPRCQRETTDSPKTFCIQPQVNAIGMIVEPALDLKDKGQGFPLGTEMIFDCEDGYEMEGDVWIIYCQLNGEWTSEPPTCKHKSTFEGSASSFCYYPGIDENGVIEDDNVEKIVEQKKVYLPGAELRYRCKNGFEVKGPNVILCTLDGEWSDDPPTCRRMNATTATPTVPNRKVCPSPTVDPNGEIEDIPPNDSRRSGQGFEAGSEVSFTCRSGFELNGSNPLTCLRNGEWTSDSPTCISIPRNSGIVCPDPGIIENGEAIVYYKDPSKHDSSFRDHSNSIVYPVDTRLSYGCTDGYRLEGEIYIDCKNNGIWSGAKPRCIEDCGSISPIARDKVTLGSFISDGEFPWIVYLFINETQQTCGGVLLDSKTVLSAAHCFENAEKITLYFGMYHKNDDKLVETRTSSEILRHPEFNRNTFDNDIAIVKISPDISYSVRIKPICIPSPKSTAVNVVPGQKGYVTGWGRNQNGVKSSRLIVSNLLVQAPETCVKTYRRRSEAVSISQGNFCANSTEKIIYPCEDGGSPMVFYNKETERYVVEGLVSYGASKRCGQQERYIIFTKVSQYLQWINQNVRNKIR